MTGRHGNRPQTARRAAPGRVAVGAWRRARRALGRGWLGATLLLAPGGAAALGGGELDAARRFDAVLRLETAPEGLCTATKIAPLMLLTAAHCVTDLATGRVKPGLAPGQVVQLGNAPAPRDDQPIAVSIDAVLLPLAYRRGLERFAAYKAARLTDAPSEQARAGLPDLTRALRIRHHFSARYPDVALLRLKTPTPSIPMLGIGLDALPAGAPVILVGYGCATAEGAGSRGMRRAGHRAWGRSRVLRADGVNLYTEAAQMQAGAPSLCPGDSGGPVLHQGRIVGVHAVVHGLHARHGARSNMAARLGALADWSAWPHAPEP